MLSIEPYSTKYHTHTVATNGDSHYHQFLLFSLQWPDYSFFRKMSWLRFIEKTCFFREISALIKEINKLYVIKVGEKKKKTKPKPTMEQQNSLEVGGGGRNQGTWRVFNSQQGTEM